MGPVRTCVGCRERRPKADLLRVVRLREGGVAVDGGRSLEGRGAYVCPTDDCIKRALGSGGIRRSLRYTGELPEDLSEVLSSEIDDG